MSSKKVSSESESLVNAEITRLLGVRRSMRLRRIMRQTNLPPEVLIDLALEILDIASRKLSPSPIERQAVGLGAARWRNVSPEARSDAMRHAAQARWAKTRQPSAGKNPREK
jgi:hypothetical protein